MRSAVRFCSLFAFCYCVAFFPIRSGAQAETDLILPAGTLLRCTLNEPQFSSKTAAVGDPVICNLAQVSLFGRPTFPRGAYLGGHLEADKDPGHFVGKGYLNIQFDHLGTPQGGLIPVSTKVISVHGYKVDREGEIIGHGHPDRDAVEWMLPPLWPIKVLTLPSRGPRPTLKGEESLTLRLMDDTAIPKLTTQAQLAPARPITGAKTSPYDALPSHYIRRPPSPPPASLSEIPLAPTAIPSNVLVFRNGLSYLATNVHIDGNCVVYTKPDGIVATNRLDEIDWTKTFQLNAEHATALTLLSGG